MLITSLMALAVTSTPGPWTLYQGTAVVQPPVAYATLKACEDAALALGVAREYQCLTAVVVKVTDDATPPAAAPVLAPVVPPPASTVASPRPAAPAARGATTAPKPKAQKALFAQLLNFAETWQRNWNHDGHRVDQRFNGNYGLWEYNETTYEPWLFDRVSVGFRLFELTGDTKWRDKALSDFAWYVARIDAQGIFTVKGHDDTKYGYVTPFVLYEKLTGDKSHRPVAKRIHDAWVREWPSNFNPNATLWTERELGLALESAVAYHELTGDAAALARARALVKQWTAASGSVGAPLVTYTRHEGGGPGGTQPTNLTNSPWMSALYFQAARRLHEVAGDTEPLAQASRYFDWLDANGFYDATMAHPQYGGLVFPRYLTGEQIGDAGYDAGNMGHCLDVGGMLRFVQVAKAARGESVDAVNKRARQMADCAEEDLRNWSRDADYLPRYRLTPPRKFNWMLRGYYEQVR